MRNINFTHNRAFDAKYIDMFCTYIDLTVKFWIRQVQKTNVWVHKLQKILKTNRITIDFMKNII